MGIVLASCAAVPLLGLLLMTGHAALLRAVAADADRLASASRLYAVELQARIGAAGAIVEAITSQDAAHDESTLRQHIAGSRVFRSVILAQRDGVLPNGAQMLRPSPAQMLALETGQSVLIPVSLGRARPDIFIGHLVGDSAAPRLAYFELSPDWLWGESSSGTRPLPLAVIDAEGTVLDGAHPIPADTARMVASRIGASSDASVASRPLGWQSEGREWHGSLTFVVPVNDRITAPPWAIIAFMPHPALLAAIESSWPAIAAAAALAILCAAAAWLYLTQAYVPALRAVQSGVALLRSRRYEALPVAGDDEPRELLDGLNHLATSLDDRFRALETLSEIDRLLLASVGLEQVLDAILSRVQAVTHCSSVGIALRDADAPGRGRVYAIGSDNVELPVCRVALDEDMLATLAGAPSGLTVARCEETRHSFLLPLKELGSDVFWLWPVTVADKLEAILAVGYRELPSADPQITHYGSEFAARLAIALSKNARDERLYRQAHFDPLTSLPNRLLFRDRLAQELASATAGLSRGALLYIDLDHFKRVNDTVGHGAGDQLLTIVAQRLRSCVKDGDTVARLGGDEFTVILRNVSDPDSAKSVADRIIESLHMPVNIAGRDHYVCASIGITLFPDDGTTIDELMRNADTAMYRAKDLGRGRTMFFDRTLTTDPTAPTETGLHRALRRREFSLFYQPQFAVADGALVGIEALLRWQTSREVMRAPGEFVPAAEESGLIVDIGGWVLEAACTQLASWRDRGIAPPRLALNVSPQQLRHPDFSRGVRRVLDKYGLPADRLEIELTERVLADDDAIASLGRLAQLGVGLTLDDFGTGYSSLSHLRKHPITAVKIERAFLADVVRAPASATLIETIIVMAHTLGKRVVAEGVETVEQLDFLRAHRCDVAQGFYLARPLTAQAMTELLQSRMSTVQAAEVRATG